MTDLSPQVMEYWKLFCEYRIGLGQPVPARYTAWGFGDSAEMADELGGLVASGIKTATASLGWVYDSELEVLPRVGDFSVILNGAGEPLCIIETTEIRITPYNDVEAEFAFDEGEGDRSLDYWRDVHWDYFSRECARIGRTVAVDMPVVCERFQVVFRK